MTRVAPLDGVRGLAILLVIVYHYFTLPLGPVFGTFLAYVQLPTLLFWGGVDLFFVLSGFLIASNLLEQRGSPGFFRRFYVRRFFRIVPAYAVILLVFFALRALRPRGLEALYAGAMPVLSYLTFTQNFFNAVEGSFGPYALALTWSLALEEQFYLVIPFLIRSLSRPMLGAAAVAIGGVAVYARSLMPGMPAYVLPFCRADALMAGVLLALAWRDPRFRDRLTRNRRVLHVALFALVMLSLSLSFWGRYKGGAANHLVLALTFSAVVLVALDPAADLGRRLFGAGLLTWLGTRSYSLYLVHDGLNAWLHAAVSGQTPSLRTARDVGVTALALAASCLVTEALFRAVERPLVTMGRRLTALPAAGRLPA